MLVKDAEVNSMSLLSAQRQVQVAHQLAIDVLELDEKQAEAVKIVKNEANLALIVIYSFEVLFMICQLGSNDFIHVLGFNHFFNLGWTSVSEIISIPFFSKDCAECL